MKRLSTFVFALLLAGSLSFAQDTGGDKAGKTPTATTTGTSDSGKKVQKSGKKSHKGGKKSKKGSASTTPPPK